MKYIKKFLVAIFDPFTTFVSKSFPEKAYNFCNKSILIQIIIAFAITIIIIFMR